jgi:hypothetical protein
MSTRTCALPLEYASQHRESRIARREPPEMIVSFERLLNAKEAALATRFPFPRAG